MLLFCQASWPRVSLFLALVLAGGGCSRAESDLASYQDDSAAATGASMGGSESEGGESESGETSDSDSDSDDSAEESGEDPPSGIDDPLAFALICDPSAQRTLDLDLGQANSEAPPVLVATSVLLGNGSVPAIPLSERAFLNRFEFGYETEASDSLEIHGELWKVPAMEPDASARYGLQYAVSAPSWPAQVRPPLDLALIIDFGLAMDGEPIELADAALAAVSSALQPGDRLTLIAAGEVPELLASSEQEGIDALYLAGLLPELELSSYADLRAALELAVDTLGESGQPSRQTRLLLVSNGHFVRDDALAEFVAALADDEILLSSLGVGDPASYDNMRMQQLAEAGGGTSLFSRDPEQLATDLGAELEAHLMSAALDIELALTLPEGLSLASKELLDEEVLPAPRRAQLGPGESLVFHFELDSCAALDPEARITVQLSWVDALSGQLESVDWERPLDMLQPPSAAAKKGTAAVAYARALQLYRDASDPAAAYGPMLDAIARIAEALELLPEDAELVEMSAVAAALEP